MRGFLPASAATVRSSRAGPQLAGGPWPRGLRSEDAALAWPQARCHRGASISQNTNVRLCWELEEPEGPGGTGLWRTSGATGRRGARCSTGGPDVIRKEAWSFYKIISGARLCWELEEPRRPEGTGWGNLIREWVVFNTGILGRPRPISSRVDVLALHVVDRPMHVAGSVDA